MTRTNCACCKKINGLKFECKFCKVKLCTFCLMPEKHNCENIIDCKRKHRDRLEDELMKNKCVKSKIEFI